MVDVIDVRSSGLRRDLALSMGDAAGYGVMAGVGEVYLPAFALALGMPVVFAGLVATVPLLAGGVLQLITPRAIVRVRGLRRWIVGSMIAQALSFVPLILVAFDGSPTMLATVTVFAAASLYWAAGMATSAAWNPWMNRVVPARVRGRFFGRRQGLVQVTMLLALIAAGFVLHFASGHELEVYAGMFGAALVARLVCAATIMRQHGGAAPAPVQRRTRLRSIPPKLRGTPRGALLGYLVAALAAAAMSGPFLTPYLLVEEHIGYVKYGVFTATIVASKIIALPWLGRLVERYGVRRVLTICAWAIAPIPLLWLVSSAMWWLLAIQIFAGVVWGGFELGMLIALFDAKDDSERTTLQVAFSGLQAITTAGASFVGGALIAVFGGDRDAYLLMFALSAIARFATVALLVHSLPATLMRLPVMVMSRAWTLAIRPWGGTIVRPIVEGIRLTRPLWSRHKVPGADVKKAPGRPPTYPARKP